jgi:hypothetical protein
MRSGYGRARQCLRPSVLHRIKNGPLSTIRAGSDRASVNARTTLLAMASPLALVPIAFETSSWAHVTVMPAPGSGPRSGSEWHPLLQSDPTALECRSKPGHDCLGRLKGINEAIRRRRGGMGIETSARQLPVPRYSRTMCNSSCSPAGARAATIVKKHRGGRM